MVYKVAPKISPPAHRGVGSEAQDQTQEVADYETALDTAGYGCFSRSALAACACAFFTTGVENCVMSYVLPAARCELQLTTYQAGLINMAFMSGGVASAFFWGIVGDVFGRRNILSLTLLMNAAITLAQSTVADYRLLLAARSINGFLIGGPSTLTFTFLSDLVGTKRRQFYLTITGMSFVGAWLILPAVAWLVIPIKISYSTLLPVYSWRLFLALCSLPAFVAGFWVMWLPESPRLLTDTNRCDKALKNLTKIHRINNGKKDDYKIKRLIQDNFVIKTLGREQSRTKVLFIGVLKDLKTFVSRLYAVKSTLILFVFFANMSAGFGLNNWVPELLLRVQGKDCRSIRLGNLPETAKLFDASNSTWRLEAHESLKGMDNATAVPYHDRLGSEGCDADMDDEVFKSGLIVGACCVLGNIACAMISARGGAHGVRNAAAVCALACALACALLASFACSCNSSDKIAVAAAAGLIAASLNGNVLLIRLLLLSLPAKLGPLGVCWGAWWGRAGGVLSNLAVGVLLDFSCPAPFITVGVLLLVSIGAIMLIKLEEIPKEIEHIEEQHKTEDGEQKNNGLDKYISTHM